MPRKKRDFVDNAFELAKHSPIACLTVTAVLAVAYAIFKWVWVPGGMFGGFLAPMTAIMAIVGAIATVWGFIHHAERQRTLNRQRSLEDLRAISWQQFEHLVSDAYKRQGYAGTDNGGSGDGGVDVILKKDGLRIAVQCKQWKTWSVSEPALRDFLGAIHKGKYDRGIFVAVGKFTAAARKFAEGTPIELVDGDQLLALVKEVQPGNHPPTPEPPNHPNTQTQAPNCPKCSTPMVKRTARRGDNAGSEFWGCPNYPSCRGTLPL